MIDPKFFAVLAAVLAILIGCASAPNDEFQYDKGYLGAINSQAPWSGTSATMDASQTGYSQFDALAKLSGRFVSSMTILDVSSEDGGSTLVLHLSSPEKAGNGRPWKLRKGSNNHLITMSFGEHWGTNYHARILPSGELLIAYFKDSPSPDGFTFRVQPDGSVYSRMVKNITIEGAFEEVRQYAATYRPERPGMLAQAVANRREWEKSRVVPRQQEEESQDNSAAVYRTLQARLAEAQTRESASRSSTSAAMRRQPHASPSTADTPLTARTSPTSLAGSGRTTAEIPSSATTSVSRSLPVARANASTLASAPSVTGSAQVAVAAATQPSRTSEDCSVTPYKTSVSAMQEPSKESAIGKLQERAEKVCRASGVSLGVPNCSSVNDVNIDSKGKTTKADTKRWSCTAAVVCSFTREYCKSTPSAGSRQ